MSSTTATGIVARVAYTSTTRNGNTRHRVTLADATTGAPLAAYVTAPDSAAGQDAQNLHRGELVTLALDGRHCVRAIVRAPQRDPREAHELRTAARNLMHSHGHPWRFYSDDDETMTRDNCGACALWGWGDDDGAPNYAGWQRVYVQTSTPVPSKYLRAFLAALDERNGEPDLEWSQWAREHHGEPDALTPYALALRSDLATFGAIINTVTEA